MSIKITGDPLPNPNISNPLSTFVIRVWREWSVDGGIWRGNIEHLESKKRTGFQDAESIIDFLRSFGVLNEVNSDDEEKNIQRNTSLK